MVTRKGEALRQNPAFEALKQAAIGLTGLAYWGDKDEALADVLAGVLTTLRAKPADLVARLALENGRGPASEVLVDAVTVGETFFFRYRDQFDALERVVLPAVLERNRLTRSLAVWSAGCSNGAEPYSLSILLGRGFANQLRGWRVDVLGTDISRAALAEAEAADYGEWSVRGLPDELRRECFKPHRGRWRLNPAYRRNVRFLEHNLVTQPPPAASFDVVLCRNVLMYFDDATRLRVLRTLASALVEGGWLLVGHAEVGPAMDALFTTVTLPQCTLYRKPEPQLPRRAAPSAPPRLLPVEADPSARVRFLLDRGEYNVAAGLCRTWAASEPLEAAPYYYLGLALEPLSEEQAIAAYRRALFIAPHLVVANFHLLRLFVRRGERGAARRHYAALLNDLASLPDDAALPLDESLRAGELAAVVRRLGRSA